jgi:secreted trypsin-like serine protease
MTPFPFQRRRRRVLRTCFGDSGGPIFIAGTSTIVAVTSFGTNLNCAGTSGAYRIDQADDLAFVATFGVTP